MIEASGHVAEVEGNYAWIRVQRQSTCGHCRAQAFCGTSALAQGSERDSGMVLVENTLELKKGEKAVVGIGETVLISASLIAYMAPILSMIFAAVIATMSGAGENTTVAVSLLGLGMGLLYLYRIRYKYSHKYRAVLLRQSNV